MRTEMTKITRFGVEIAGEGGRKKRNGQITNRKCNFGQ